MKRLNKPQFKISRMIMVVIFGIALGFFTGSNPVQAFQGNIQTSNGGASVGPGGGSIQTDSGGGSVSVDPNGNITGLQFANQNGSFVIGPGGFAVGGANGSLSVGQNGFSLGGSNGGISVGPNGIGVNIGGGRQMTSQGGLPMASGGVLPTSQGGFNFVAIVLLPALSNLLLVIVLGSAVLAVIYSGMLFMVSGGDGDLNGRAQKGLTWALIGVAVSVCSFGLVRLVINLNIFQ